MAAPVGIIISSIASIFSSAIEMAKLIRKRRLEKKREKKSKGDRRTQVGRPS